MQISILVLTKELAIWKKFSKLNYRFLNKQRVTSLEKTFELIHESCIDSLFIDIDLLEGNAANAIYHLQQSNFEIPIIVILSEEDEAQATEMQKAGAQDFILKSEIEEKIVLRAIRYAKEKNQLLNQLQKSHDLEHHLAYHDFLTGLPNRLLFQDRLNQAVVQCKRSKDEVALFFLDLDGFKKINDTLGHSFGDQLLKMVASRLKRAIRESDTVSRFGGDEFTVLLQKVKSATDTKTIAKKILDILSKPFMINEREIYITTSIGISLFPKDANDSETLVKKADVAMYRAKSAGKNNYMHYTFSMDESLFESLTLENSLRKAIKQDHLVVYYQPQIEVTTGKIFGLEALVRWQHPDYGLIPPDRFITLAEETGLITEIDEWVLRKACEQTKTWHSAGFKNLKIAVNLSGRNFKQKNLFERFNGILKDTGFPAEHLWVEITEKSIVSNIEQTIEVLHQLKNIGLKIALDDFGIAYSSLNYLKRLPIDMLKVDRSFVAGIPADRDDSAISTAIVVLAKSMMLQVIAEGVETKEQLMFFKALNCEGMQGYLFGKPQTAASITSLLQSNLNFTNHFNLSPQLTVVK